jgi:hypothetical protein
MSRATSDERGFDMCFYAYYIVAKSETPYCCLSATQLIIIESNLKRLFYTLFK